jgi:hypothetical protein
MAEPIPAEDDTPPKTHEQASESATAVPMVDTSTPDQPGAPTQPEAPREAARQASGPAPSRPPRVIDMRRPRPPAEKEEPPRPRPWPVPPVAERRPRRALLGDREAPAAAPLEVSAPSLERPADREERAATTATPRRDRPSFRERARPAQQAAPAPERREGDRLQAQAPARAPQRPAPAPPKPEPAPAPTAPAAAPPPELTWIPPSRPHKKKTALTPKEALRAKVQARAQSRKAPRPAPAAATESAPAAPEPAEAESLEAPISTPEPKRAVAAPAPKPSVKRSKPRPVAPPPPEEDEEAPPPPKPGFFQKIMGIFWRPKPPAA